MSSNRSSHRKERDYSPAGASAKPMIQLLAIHDAAER